MAIETKIQLSENRSLDGTYVNINGPISFKRIERVNKGSDEDPEWVDETKLKLRYDWHMFSEKGGAPIRDGQSEEIEYQGGDIWEESYAHLKSIHPKSKDL